MPGRVPANQRLGRQAGCISLVAEQIHQRRRQGKITHRKRLAQLHGGISLANSASRPSPVFFTVRPLWLADLRIDQFPEVGLEALVRPLLISSHQARIARHIGGKDRCEATDRGHVLPGGKVPLFSLPQKPAVPPMARVPTPSLPE